VKFGLMNPWNNLALPA